MEVSMPWRLVLFVVFVVFFAAFMGANLENKTPISLIFYVTEPIAVYMIILYSFVAGIVVMLPFTFAVARRKKAKSENIEKEPKKKARKNEEAQSDADYTEYTSESFFDKFNTDKLKNMFSKKQEAESKTEDNPDQTP